MKLTIFGLTIDVHRAKAEDTTAALSVSLSRWLGSADAKPEGNKHFSFTKDNIEELTNSQTPWELRIDYDHSFNGTIDPKVAVRITSASFIQRWNVVKSAFLKVA